ncbi:MAG: VapC toxin family PIN domain ribonuclease [Polyangiaceae bacterium]|nr:VapC toxin family PIN domain ribonuclease [Polyangiaceae bacterium]
MSRCLVLHAEAMSALGGRSTKRQREVRAAMSAAFRLGREVVVPAVVLAELYRGRDHDQLLDACLSRETGETGIYVRPTDRSMARLVGGILAAAGVGSTFMVDAHVVAAAVELGGGVVLTADAGDLRKLSAPYRNVTVVDIG